MKQYARYPCTGTEISSALQLISLELLIISRYAYLYNKTWITIQTSKQSVGGMPRLPFDTEFPHLVSTTLFDFHAWEIKMTSSNGTNFRVTCPLCGEFTGPGEFLAGPVNSSHKGQWLGALMFSLICTRINGWVNNREAGDLKRQRAHYDIMVMIITP